MKARFFLFLIAAVIVMPFSLVAAEEEKNALADGNNQFALDLYAKIKSKEGNLFFSPYSITTAFGLLQAGAKNETADQIADVFNFPENVNELNEAFRKFQSHLNELGLKGDIQLSVANALWAQKKYSFLESYLRAAKKYYDAQLTNLDFFNPVQACKQINEWVEKKTHSKIKNLVSPGAVSPQTQLILTNAIYFFGHWDKAFKKEDTQEAADFYLENKAAVKAAMMFQKEKFSYGENDDLQALELPYKGRALSMIVLLPKKRDGLAGLENELDEEKLKTWLAVLGTPQEVQVYLPKFKMESSFSLSETLAGMGMSDAFDAKADFSGIDGGKSLFISAVLHKAFVEVDEKGTEAAAATAIIMSKTAFMPEKLPVVFKADHPFLFLIRENASGAILFWGRMSNPNTAM
ncbi:MAG: serpin family protein [bacterium]